MGYVKNQRIIALQKQRDTQGLIRGLVRGKVAGEPVVTVSLRARSIAALHMIAQNDPNTPVIFCHASNVFPESDTYREAIVSRLGLTNVRVQTGSANAASSGVWSRCEHLWAEDAAGGGRVHQIVHLDDLIDGHNVWLSAVYPFARDRQGRARFAQAGDVLRVDPLHGWPDEKVLDYLKGHDIPLHPRAYPERAYQPAVAEAAALSYAF